MIWWLEISIHSLCVQHSSESEKNVKLFCETLKRSSWSKSRQMIEVQRETWWKSYETISNIWRWIQSNRQSKKNENEAFETKTFWWAKIWQVALSQSFITLTASTEWFEAMYAKKNNRATKSTRKRRAKQYRKSTYLDDCLSWENENQQEFCYRWSSKFE
jgi:hypothetical protein